MTTGLDLSMSRLFTRLVWLRCMVACLLVGLWVALAPERLGKRPLASAAPFATALFTAWLVLTYSATAIGAVYELPPVMRSLGIYVRI
jgi:hypothetical protein